MLTAFAALLAATMAYLHTSPPAQAQAPAGGVTPEHRFIRLTEDAVEDSLLAASPDGKVLWGSSPGIPGGISTSRRLYLYDGEETVSFLTFEGRLSNMDPVISGGCVIWNQQVPDGQGGSKNVKMFYVQGKGLLQITSSTVKFDSFAHFAHNGRFLWKKTRRFGDGTESYDLTTFDCSKSALGDDPVRILYSDPGNPNASNFDDIGNAFQMKEGVAVWHVGRSGGDKIFMNSGGENIEISANDPNGVKFLNPTNDQGPGLSFFGPRWTAPNVGGGRIAWTSEDDQDFFDDEVMVYEVGTGAFQQLTHNAIDDKSIQVDANGNVAWFNDTGVFLYDGSDIIKVHANPTDGFGLVDEFLLDGGNVLYEDGADLYLYESANDASRLVASNRSLVFGGSSLAFGDGQVAIGLRDGAEDVLKFFDGATAPVEIRRTKRDAGVSFPHPYSLADYETQFNDVTIQDGHAVWAEAHRYQFRTDCEDPDLGEGPDSDLYHFDASTGTVVQVTRSEVQNDVRSGWTANGAFVWQGASVREDCGSGFGGAEAAEAKEVFLGGEPIPFVTGRVSVKDANGATHHLPDLKVTLSWGGKQLVQRTDAGGRFHFLMDDPNAASASGFLEIALEDRQGWIKVQHGDPPQDVTFRTASFNFPPPKKIVRNIDVSNTAAFASTSIGAANQGRLDDLAVIYHFTHMAALFGRDHLKITYDSNLREEIRAWGPDSGVFHRGDATDFINIEPGGSAINDNSWPDNREWHEFAHHIMHDAPLGGDNTTPDYNEAWKVDVDDNRNGLFNEKNLDIWAGGVGFTLDQEGPEDLGGDHNHWGYPNPSTTDSLVEGFAEFISMVIADVMTGDPNPQLYRWDGNNDNLEGPYFTWNDEEFAAATTLWDLYDSNVDSYDYDVLHGWNLGTSLDDRIDLTLDGLWGRLNKTTVTDFKDVYDAMADLNQNDSDGDGIKDVDEIFIMHGFFEDKAPFTEYNADKSEEVGRAAYKRSITFTENAVSEKTAGGNRFVYDNGDGALTAADVNRTNERLRRPADPDRRGKPPRPGSVMRVSVVDASTGEPLENVTLAVDKRFQSPHGALDHSYTIQASGLPGEVPITMPTLPAEATIVAQKEGFQDSAPVTITSQAYWDKLESGALFIAEHTFSLVESGTGPPGTSTAVAIPLMKIHRDSEDYSQDAAWDGDDEDGATGVIVGIEEVVDGDGNPVSRDLGSYTAELRYDGSCLNVLEMRTGRDFSVASSTIDNPGGLAAFSGTSPQGDEPESVMAFAVLRLIGDVNQTCTLEVEFTDLKDAGGNPVGVDPDPVMAEFRRGNARQDDRVSIADALFGAQYLADLREGCVDITPPGETDAGNADTSCMNPVNLAGVKTDGDTDRASIADVLFIAQQLADLRDGGFKLKGP